MSISKLAKKLELLISPPATPEAPLSNVYRLADKLAQDFLGLNKDEKPASIFMGKPNGIDPNAKPTADVPDFAKLPSTPSTPSTPAGITKDPLQTKMENRGPSGTPGSHTNVQPSAPANPKALKAIPIPVQTALDNWLWAKGLIPANTKFHIGGKGGKPDGVWGDKTDWAIKQYKKMNGITSIDDKTLFNIILNQKY